MKRVLLLQLDGKLPNLALMRIAAHHRALGDVLVFQAAGSPRAVERELWDRFDLVYASLIFTRTKPVARRLLETRPDAFVGGTGWEMNDGELPLLTFRKKPQRTLESIGIATRELDYSLYPGFTASIGRTQVGCSESCAFCCVPGKEPELRFESSINNIWRGGGHPRHIHLLDNDFFGLDQGGNESWRRRIKEIREGKFRVCFNQGINVRKITEETAAAIAGISYCDDQFRVRRLYTAWDSRHDEDTLFNGLRLLFKHGVKADQVMVYMLIGFYGNDRTPADWEYRRARLRQAGCRPFPMPYLRHPADPSGRPCLCDECRQRRGYARWVILRCDLMIPWERWEEAGYQPGTLQQRQLAELDTQQLRLAL